MTISGLVAAVAVVAGCGGETGDGIVAEKGTVELAYVEWDSEVASTYVIKEVLESMGYDVELTSVSAAVMWTAVGNGDVDGMVAAWLPTTHAGYLEKVQDSVVDLGPNLSGTRIGLVVPQYVTIDSVPQITEHAEQFDGRIVGIEPGAGIMSRTEEAIQTYGLEDIELVSSSSAAMAAELANAVENNRWIVVTGWTPHWKFSRWDLKYLNDPQNVYGGEEQIHTIVRQGLEEEMPEVYAVLDNFQWTAQDMQQVMLWNQEDGADPEDSAERWIEQNPEKVASWLPGQQLP